MKRRPVDARHVPERLLRTLETGRAGIRICTAAVNGRVCICVRNASDSALTVLVKVPSTSLRFTDIAAAAVQCQAVQIDRDGSLDVEMNGTTKGLDYVHADMGGDLLLRYADGTVSLVEHAGDPRGIFSWRSCW